MSCRLDALVSIIGTLPSATRAERHFVAKLHRAVLGTAHAVEQGGARRHALVKAGKQLRHFVTLVSAGLRGGRIDGDVVEQLMMLAGQAQDRIGALRGGAKR